MIGIAVVGAGMSGLMAAHLIKSRTDASVTIIEQGESYQERVSSDSPSLVSGIGGAGTVFGGKLCFPPASSGVWKKTGYTHSGFQHFLDRCFRPFLNDDTVLSYKNPPSDFSCTKNDLDQKNYHSVLLTKGDMYCFVNNILNTLTNDGVIIKNRCEFINSAPADSGYIITYREMGHTIYAKFDMVIFATGRSSAQSIQKWLPQNIPLKLQSPDLGLRFSLKLSEHSLFREIGRDIKLKALFNDIRVRTFCVCSGGNKTIVDLHDMTYYDGHFDESLTDIANLGILARSPHILGYEGASVYCSCLRKFLHSDLSLKDFIVYKDKFISGKNYFDDIFDAIKNFILLLQKNKILEGNLDVYPAWLPSVDHLNPLVQTDNNFMTNLRNVYVIGDAVGISRGFIQSLWSSYCASMDIIMKLSGYSTVTNTRNIA